MNSSCVDAARNSRLDSSPKIWKCLRCSLTAFLANLLVVVGMTSQTSVHGGELLDQVSDANNYGYIGVGYYDPNGLTGDIFLQTANFLGLPVLTTPDLAMPGPGPKTGQLPKVASIFQYTVVPSSITPDDFAPGQNPNQEFSYTISGGVSVASSWIPADFIYPFNFDVKGSINDTFLGNPGWWLVDSHDGQDTWAHIGISLNPNSGKGFIAFASTNASPLNPYLPHTADAGLITGGYITTTYTAVPEVGSFGITGLGLGVILVGCAVRRRFV